MELVLNLGIVITNLMLIVTTTIGSPENREAIRQARIARRARHTRR